MDDESCWESSVFVSVARELVVLSADVWLVVSEADPVVWQPAERAKTARSVVRAIVISGRRRRVVRRGSFID
jgi:hypothetical protein